MSEKLKLCTVKEIHASGRKSLITRYGRILVVKKDEEYFAVEDRCSHADYPLNDGDLEGYELECSRHGARFDIRNGKCLRMPAVEPIETYAVSIVDGVLEIEIP